MEEVHNVKSLAVAGVLHLLQENLSWVQDKAFDVNIRPGESGLHFVGTVVLPTIWYHNMHALARLLHQLQIMPYTIRRQ